MRAPPVAVETGAVGGELWFTQTGTIWEQRPGGAADRLQNSLRPDVVFNVRLKGLVAEDEIVDEGLECQGGITRPCVEIYQSINKSPSTFGLSTNPLTVWVDFGRASNDKATTSSRHFDAVGTDIVQHALESN